MDSLSTEKEVTTDKNSLLGYPMLKTLLALLAFASISFAASSDHLNEYGFVGLAISSLFVGVMLLIALKLVAVPCAFVVSMSSGLMFKHAYYKTLGLIYYVPFVLLVIVVFLFSAHYFINNP